jgi:transcription elongation factor Elf1
LRLAGFASLTVPRQPQATCRRKQVNATLGLNSNVRASQSQKSPMTYLASKITATCLSCQSMSSSVMVCEASSEHSVLCDKCGNAIASVKVITFTGYIYILTSPTQIDIYKIGQTTRPVEERVRELSQATGLAAPFNTEATFPSLNPQEDERIIHARLSAHRYSESREFFSASFEEIFSVCQQQTNIAPNYLNPNIKSGDLHDPWLKFRRTSNPIVTSASPTASPISPLPPRIAFIANRSFHCPQCKSKMRPVKALLAARGVFRGCTSCGILVSRSGIEIQLPV